MFCKKSTLHHCVQLASIYQSFPSTIQGFLSFMMVQRRNDKNFKIFQNYIRNQNHFCSKSTLTKFKIVLIPRSNQNHGPDPAKDLKFQSKDGSWLSLYIYLFIILKMSKLYPIQFWEQMLQSWMSLNAKPQLPIQEIFNFLEPLNKVIFLLMFNSKYNKRERVHYILNWLKYVHEMYVCMIMKLFCYISKMQ